MFKHVLIIKIWYLLNILYKVPIKVVMQGKLFQRCTHLLYWSVLSLSGNVNTRLMKKPDIGSIFHIENEWNILVIGKYYVNFQNYQNFMLLTPSDTKQTIWRIYYCLKIPPRENWFQYVRRVYATAINFPSLHYILGAKVPAQ